jgi:DCN1-like protein 1/2
MRYLQSLDIGLEEPTVLALSELLRAPTMGEFSRAGFLEGWSSISVSTFDGMRSRVPALRASLSSDEDTFKRVYLFTYNFARSPGQKSLALEVATEYWKLLLNGRFPSAHLRAWIEFLEREYGKSVAKDTWNCMYDFVQLVQKDPGLKGYDLDGKLETPLLPFSHFCAAVSYLMGSANLGTGAWPSILDDFVRYWRRKNEMDAS